MICTWGNPAIWHTSTSCIANKNLATKYFQRTFHVNPIISKMYFPDQNSANQGCKIVYVYNNYYTHTKLYKSNKIEVSMSYSYCINILAWMIDTSSKVWFSASTIVTYIKDGCMHIYLDSLFLFWEPFGILVLPLFTSGGDSPRHDIGRAFGRQVPIPDRILYGSVTISNPRALILRRKPDIKQDRSFWSPKASVGQNKPGVGGGQIDDDFRFGTDKFQWFHD